MQPQTGGTAGLARRQENLAYAFQELLTVCERLRSGRQQVTDAETFRRQVREAIKRADAEARGRGYTAEQIRLAIFAVVAFLDESVLNLRSPVFADWPRRPMQEELFGLHVAGEVFFQNVQKLLGMTDSPELADVLEVYQLCLLLGFAGRYSLSGRERVDGRDPVDCREDPPHPSAVGRIFAVLGAAAGIGGHDLARPIAESVSLRSHWMRGARLRAIC